MFIGRKGGNDSCRPPNSSLAACQGLTHADALGGLPGGARSGCIGRRAGRLQLTEPQRSTHPGPAHSWSLRASDGSQHTRHRDPRGPQGTEAKPCPSDCRVHSPPFHYTFIVDKTQNREKSAVTEKVAGYTRAYAPSPGEAFSTACSKLISRDREGIRTSG